MLELIFGVKVGVTGRGCKPKPPKIPSPQPQLRSSIGQVGGKKGLTGRTDIEIEREQPVRAADRPRDPLRQLRHPAAAAHQVRGERQRESPGAARSSCRRRRGATSTFNGHFTFRGGGQAIDLDAIVAGLDLG